MTLAPNNLLDLVAQDRVCTAFGIKISTGVEIVHIAKTAGYDSLFIDLEHTTLSLRDAGQQCLTALALGITPFVRIPQQCGDGFVQRVLDMGAMGVIVPHVDNIDTAKRAISISKYPTRGKRSLTANLPHYGMATVPASKVVPEMNARGSTVFLMIETAEGLENVDEIAGLTGCDVLLVGSNDLAIELGVAGDWDNPAFINALQRVANAAEKNGKIFGIAGVYNRPDLMERVVNDMGVRWMVGVQDATLLSIGGKANVELLKSIQRSSK